MAKNSWSFPVGTLPVFVLLWAAGCLIIVPPAEGAKPSGPWDILIKQRERDRKDTNGQAVVPEAKPKEHAITSWAALPGVSLHRGHRFAN